MNPASNSDSGSRDWAAVVDAGWLGVLVFCLSTRAAGASDIQVVSLGQLRQWQRTEFRLKGLPPAGNVFDPGVIRVEGALVLPSQRTLTFPAYWHQDYERSLNNGVERLTPAGAPGWRLRCATPEAGAHSLQVRVWTHGQWFGESGTIRLEAEPAKTPATNAAGLAIPRGATRVAASRQYFETGDGSPMPLVGACVCWPGARGTYDYDDWFAGMSRAGENYTRLWMAPWAFGIEAEPGTLTQYRLDRAWQLDYALQLAEQQGIGIMLCLDYHGMFETEIDVWGGNNYWPNNPYNAVQGGPCADPSAFFTSAAARAIYQKRLRYLVARYGYSSSLLAWEFFNELDNVYRYLVPAEVARWHADMADWLHRYDPLNHLVTTSLTGGSDRADIWSLPGLDFTQYHAYGMPKPATGLAEVSQSFLRRYGKPVLIGEYGVDWRGWSLAADPYWRGFRQGVWGGLLGGSAGTAMSWWWEDLHAQNAYPYYGVVNDYLRTTRWGQGAWRAVQFANSGPPPTQVGALIPGGQPFSVTLPLDTRWGATLPGQLAVNSARCRDYSASVWNAYVQGTGHPELRNPCKFEAWLGNDAQLTLHVNSVSSGAILHVRVDGKSYFTRSLPNLDGTWQVNHEYDTNVVVNLPAGKHLVEIRNGGGDWFYLDWIRVDNALPADYATAWEPTPGAVGLTRNHETLLYVVNPDAEYPANATNAIAAAQTNGAVVLTDWRPGGYRATWRDPRNGTYLGATRGVTSNAVLVLPLPSFFEDLAGRLTPEFQLSEPRWPAAGDFEFRLASEPGRGYVLESSADLGTWNDSATGTNASGDSVIAYPDATRDGSRYFRVRAAAP